MFGKNLLFFREIGKILLLCCMLSPTYSRGIMFLVEVCMEGENVLFLYVCYFYV